MKQTEADKILELTKGGISVFTHYLGEGCLKKKFCNPFREDHHPSCRLYKNVHSGIVRYYMRDFAHTELSGDCFWMVSKVLNVDLEANFKLILQTIDKDLCLGVFNETPLAKCVSVDYAAKLDATFNSLEESSIDSFNICLKEFSADELSYWGKYGIKKATLDAYDVKSIQSCEFRRKNGSSFSVFASSVIPMFGYCFGNGEGYKLYRPKSRNRFLYAGKLPRPYVFGVKQLPSVGDMVFITGGEKDVMSLHAHGFHGLALNSETASVSDQFMEDLCRRFKNIIFLYDADETGKNESLKNYEKYSKLGQVSRLVLPLAGTKKEKDISDYFALGNSASDLRQLIKNVFISPETAK
nr:toprim domain-containing protein [uncultured Lachnoclostridium sp.]